MSTFEAEMAERGVAARRTDDSDRAAPRAARRVLVAAMLLGLMAAGGFLRLAHLDTLTAQVDEGFQALAVQGILEHGYPKLETGLVYGRSPVFLYTQAAFAAVFGLSEWTLRLPAAMFGVLGIPAAFLLGWRLFAPWKTSNESILLSRVATQRGPGDHGSRPALRCNAAWQGTAGYGLAVGLVLAAMMAVSAWEIEYARYGRFYTLFQLTYILGVVAFVDGYLRGKAAGKAAFWVLFLLTVSVHDLGVMLGLCFWAILPLRGYPRKQKAVWFALSALCGALWVGYTKLWRGLAAGWSDAVPDANYAGLGAMPVTGDGVLSSLIAKVAGMLPGVNLPDLRMLEAVWADRPWVLALIALPAVAATGVLVAAKLNELRGADGPLRGTRNAPGSAVAGRLWLPLLLTAVWAATLQQFALAGVALLGYAALYVRSWRHWLRRSELVTLGACAVAMGLWVLYFWSSDSIHKHVWVPAVTNLPAVHTYFLQWFVPGWKRMLVLLLPATYVVARRAAAGANDDGRCNGAWLLLTAIAVPILVTSELKWQFSESRYFFHLYPLILAVLAAGVVAMGAWAARRLSLSGGATAIAVVVVLGGAMVFTRDLNPAQAYAVTTRTHQSTKDPIRSTINFSFYAGWPQDQKTAALAALDQIEDGDRVLVVGPVQIAANYRWYLGGIDYIASTLPIYNSVKSDADGHWIDLATGGEVVSTTARLREVAAQAERDGVALWVFSDTVMTAPENWYLSDAEPELKQAIAVLSAEALLTGKDGRTTVSRVEHPATLLEVALPEAAHDETAREDPRVQAGDRPGMVPEANRDAVLQGPAPQTEGR